MTTLQTFLIGKPPPLLLLHPGRCRIRPSKFQFSSLTVANKSLNCPRRVTSCANSSSESVLNAAAEVDVSGFDANNQDPGDLTSEPGDVGTSGDTEVKVEGEGLVEKKRSGIPIPLLVFLVGVWARIRKSMEAVLALEWMSWWPFGQQEKRLERLIAEAEANPLDAEKQSALLVELNKHR